MKTTTLREVADLVGSTPTSALPEAVANCISNPDEVKELEERLLKQNINQRETDELVIRLRGEIQNFRKDLDASRDQVKAAMSLQEETKDGALTG